MTLEELKNKYKKVGIRYTGRCVILDTSDLTEDLFIELDFKRLSGGSVPEYHHKDYKGF